MRQTVSMTSTYSSDEFGICSSLYELGGMVVMHDASGCNSTYTTHDEPRWYEMDSMIYISAISEMEAVMGDDEKFINDVVETARLQKPEFIALVGAPIPYMIGTDFEAIARIIEDETGIPCMGFQANGMQYYTKGISMAMAEVVERFCGDTQTKHGADCRKEPESSKADSSLSINLIGITPLDHSWHDTMEDLKRWMAEQGMQLNVSLSMGCSFEDLPRLPYADVNLVLSSGGLRAAQLMYEKYKIPYVTGVPYGSAFAEKVASDIRKAQEEQVCINAYKDGVSTDRAGNVHTDHKEYQDKKLLIIGEAVTSASLAAALTAQYGVKAQVADPLGTFPQVLREGDVTADSEDALIRLIADADVIFADPLYRPLTGNKIFVAIPHTAFSGRIYEKRMPRMIGRPLEIEKEMIC